jgi:hypothetical protein
MNELLLGQVRRRAGSHCEYCQYPEWAAPTPFEIDHVIAQQHGGRTQLSNLAHACYACNKHKGPNIASIDPKTRKLVPLFNPRRHKWARHFEWDGPRLQGRTPIGRATIRVLAINDPFYIIDREALIEEGSFPPDY